MQNNWLLRKRSKRLQAKKKKQVREKLNKEILMAMRDMSALESSILLWSVLEQEGLITISEERVIEFSSL